MNGPSYDWPSNEAPAGAAVSRKNGGMMSIQSLIMDPRQQQLRNRVDENTSSNNLPVTGSTSPVNERKQLSDKLTARKSAKHPPGLGQPHVTPLGSPLRRPSRDRLPTDPRPAKRQCLSSFSKNSGSHPPDENMLRQSEETTYELSAVDGFALRPKNKEVSRDSKRSKAYSEQRKLRQDEKSQNNPNEPLKNSNVNGISHFGSPRVALTESNDQELYITSQGAHDFPLGNPDAMVLDKEGHQEGLPQESLLHSPTVQPIHHKLAPIHYNSTQKLTSGLQTHNQTSNIPSFKDTSVPMQVDSPPSISKEVQLVHEVRKFPLDRKISSPTGLVPEDSEIKRIIPPTELSESTVHIESSPEAPVAPQGHLSTLLGGREWKKMSPEERRLFWVSQHDEKQFDAYIYSENNRPFRPGGDSGNMNNIVLPSRSKRAGTHYDYIDPRTHYSSPQSEEFHEIRQKEIKVRPRRKENASTSCKGAPPHNYKQKQHFLPKRVQENPQWVKAVKLLESYAAVQGKQHSRIQEKPSEERWLDLHG